MQSNRIPEHQANRLFILSGRRNPRRKPSGLDQQIAIRNSSITIINGYFIGIARGRLSNMLDERSLRKIKPRFEGI